MSFTELYCHWENVKLFLFSVGQDISSRNITHFLACCLWILWLDGRDRHLCSTVSQSIPVAYFQSAVVFLLFFFFYNSLKNLFMHREHYTSFLFFAIWIQLIHTCMHISFLIYSFHLCVCMHMTRGNQRTTFIFRWVLTFELPSLGLHSKCFYLLSHLAAKEHAHFKNFFSS